MLINSGKNFNLREVCRCKGVTIAAILIQKESRESEKGAFLCHATLAVIVGGGNGKMVTALLMFFLFSCVYVSQEEILSTPQRVFGNSEDQTGRKRAEGRAVCSGLCRRSTV